ncbi:hypothetical protein J8I87_38870, partial [Paraburkholderia sp. LEh10]|uniref:hypothetical protein n=1 Tax=Paraburkholderia sp. LEh10 TaxID=2821353 RepID=UPI001AE243B6
MVCVALRGHSLFAAIAVAGIRDAVFVLPLSLASAMRVVLPLSLASAMRLAAQALPLCGAAPTFFAAAKKVGKESRSHRQ